MSVFLVVAAVVGLPLAGFGLLMWLCHLEETLPRDVSSAQRRPVPAPILAIPVRPRPAVPVAAVGPAPVVADVPSPSRHREAAGARPATSRSVSA